MASLRILNFGMLHLVDSIVMLRNELYFMRFIHVTLLTQNVFNG